MAAEFCEVCGGEIVVDVDAEYAYRHAGTSPVEDREAWARGGVGEELLDPGYDHHAEPV